MVSPLFDKPSKEIWRKTLARYPLGLAGLVFLPATLCGLFLPFSPLLTTCGLVGVLSVTLIFRQKRFYPLPILLGVSLFAVALLNSAAWQQQQRPWLEPNASPVKVDSLRGVVYQQGPGRGAITVNRVLIKTAGQSRKLQGLLLIQTGAQDSGQLLPGNRLLCTNLQLEPLPRPRNPGDFDYGQYLRRNGICAIARLAKQATPEVTATSASFPYFVFRLRSSISSIIDGSFQQPVNGFLNALILGDRRLLDPELKSNFSNTGIMHLLAVSGLHTGFVLILILILLSFFQLTYQLRNLIAVAFLLAYACITGAGAPVVRAATLGTLYLFAENTGRPARFLNLIGFAAILQLLLEPALILRLEFQLSFAAVTAIVIVYPRTRRLRRKWLRLLPEKPRNIIDNWILSPLIVSFAAQIGTLPFLVSGFGQVPFLGILLNIVAVPLIAFLLITTFLYLGLTMLSGPITVIAGLIAAASQLMFQLVNTATDIPGISLSIPAAWRPPILWLWGGSLFLAMVYRQPLPRRVIPQIILIIVLFSLDYGRHFQITFLDVGQGDGAVVETPSGKHLLIDAGPSSPRYDAGERIVLPFLKYSGIDHIRGLFISHSHRDHIGGARAIINVARVDSVYLPLGALLPQEGQKLLDDCQRRNTGVRYLSAGDRLQIDEQTIIYVLGPDSAALHRAGIKPADLNNFSQVFLLKHRQGTVLFTGDAEEPAETIMLNWGSFIDVDILKVGHHGSATSSAGAFLDLLTPQYAVISCGNNNRFDHPAAQTLQQLQKRQSTVLRTDHDGAIVLRWEQHGWSQVNW